MRIKDIEVGEPYFCYQQTGDEPAIAEQINRISPRRVEVVLKQPDGSLIISDSSLMLPWDEYLKELKVEDHYLKQQDKRGAELSEIVGGKVTFDDDLLYRYRHSLWHENVLGLDETAALSLLAKLGGEPPRHSNTATRQSQLSEALREALGFGTDPSQMISGKWDAILCLTDEQIEQLTEKLGVEAEPNPLARLLS